ncbi:MAG: ribosome biogenesis GTP-binding protein YihA/YsxC [Hyphomonadaceae bacterium]|nr:ribosome biogenesis GTP-binding protein YihA/YsxC [Hyphomonadaceae bacterium]
MNTELDPLEAGRLLFAGPINFELGVAKMDGLPSADVPEIAFAGRSNVGKSSLLNALTGRKALARASAEPGRTRELNYFRVGDTLRLVDLPGYGYAKAPKAEIARWTALMRDFMRGRAALKRVLLLVDARHGLKEHDIDVMDALDTAAVTYQIVLTKADKLKPTESADRAAETYAAIAKRPAAHPRVLITSSETGAGIPELRAEIAALA